MIKLLKDQQCGVDGESYIHILNSGKVENQGYMTELSIKQNQFKKDKRNGVLQDYNHEIKI